MPTMFKTAALALAASGLALSIPAAAQPAPHAAAWSHSQVWSSQSQNHERDYRDSRYGAYGSGGYDNGYRQSAYGEPVYANTRVWQGDDGRYYCRKSNGTTGLVIGAAGGALLGRAVVGRNGDRTLGAILGAAGGALLGRQVEKNASRCR